MIEFAFSKRFEDSSGFCLDLKARIAKRGITAVLGKSGSGKTSLVMMLAGLLKADEGYVRVGEQVFEDTRKTCARGLFVAPENRGIGFVFQNHRLFPYMTVRENILFACRHGARKSRCSYEEVLGLMHLEALQERLPASLSGGEAQRTALARAMLAAQNLLIMDEPTASLDPELRAELNDYIGRIPDSTGVPVIYITHLREEARQLADEALFIRNGRICAQGSIGTVLDAYRRFT